MPPPSEARVAARLIEQIIDAASVALPNESVGLLVGPAIFVDGGAPARYVPLHNAAASPYRYLSDADEQLRVWMELDDADEVVWAIVHSHVASPAEPSPTDISLAFYPDSLYVICSLADPDVPVVRAWSIRDGSAAEVQLAVAA